MSDVYGAEDSFEDATTEELTPEQPAQVSPAHVSEAYQRARKHYVKWQELRERRLQLEASREKQTAVAYVSLQKEVGRVSGREYVAPHGAAELSQEMMSPNQQTMRGAASQLARGHLPTQMPVINRAPRGGVGGAGLAGVQAAANAAEEWLRADGGLRAAANAAEEYLRIGRRPLPIPPGKGF
jgi:hypothetical protein